MSARIDGVSWGAASTSALNLFVGQLEITGVSSDYSVSLELAHVSAPDTFALGVGSSIIGGRGIVTWSFGDDTIWTTSAGNLGGEVIINTLTPSRVAGTFHFGAGLFSNPASTRTVTQGTFDIPITGTSAGLSAGDTGHRIEGSVPTAFIATNASLSWPATPSPTLSITAGGFTNLLVSLENVPGTGTYALDTLPPLRSITVVSQPGAPAGQWTSARPGGGGSVIVTSVTPQRIRGTFSATVIALQSGTAASFPVSGVFDMGRAGP